MAETSFENMGTEATLDVGLTVHIICHKPKKVEVREERKIGLIQSGMRELLLSPKSPL
jgi:hypothetical protein